MTRNNIDFFFLGNLTLMITITIATTMKKACRKQAKIHAQADFFLHNLTFICPYKVYIDGPCELLLSLSRPITHIENGIKQLLYIHIAYR